MKMIRMTRMMIDERHHVDLGHVAEALSAAACGAGLLRALLRPGRVVCDGQQAVDDALPGHLHLGGGLLHAAGNVIEPR
jgi:hypothetical protein